MRYLKQIVPPLSARIRGRPCRSRKSTVPLWAYTFVILSFGYVLLIIFKRILSYFHMKLLIDYAAV